MADATFSCPDLTTFLGLDALGLLAVGQRLEARRAVIECRMPISVEDPFCKACGAQGAARGTVQRRLAHLPVGWRPTELVVRLRSLPSSVAPGHEPAGRAHLPVGWRPTELVVRLRRFACAHCHRLWRQDTSRLAGPRARLTHSAVQWGLEALGVELMSVSRVAQALGVAWHTASTAILARAQQAIAQDPHRLAGVEALGVDEHVWRHTKRGDRYVTVIIDLTPVRDGRGPARLLEAGR